MSPQITDMPRNSNTFFVIAISTLLFCTSVAYGDVTEITSSSVYSATSVPYATIYFDALAPGSTTVPESSPLVIGGLTLTGSSATFSVVPPAVTSLPGDATPFLQVSATTPPADNSSYFSITLPAFNSATPVTAIGFSIGNGSSVPVNLEMDVFLADGTQQGFEYVAPSASTGLAFLGFEAVSPISSIEVFLPNSTSVVDLDNLTYGVTVPEPLPTSLLLVVAGSLGLWQLRRRLGGLWVRQS